MKANIVFKDDRWKIIPLQEMAQVSLKLIAAEFLEEGKLFEISVLATDDREIMNLNKRYRGYNVATNILSWPEHEYKRLIPGNVPIRILNAFEYSKTTDFIGNLAISFDRCFIEAKEENITLEDHISHLIIHGCLHLIGFEHKNALDAILMEDTEKRLLSYLGIKNPYEFKDR